MVHRRRHRPRAGAAAAPGRARGAARRADREPRSGDGQAHARSGLRRRSPGSPATSPASTGRPTAWPSSTSPRCRHRPGWTSSSRGAGSTTIPPDTGEVDLARILESRAGHAPARSSRTTPRPTTAGSRRSPRAAPWGRPPPMGGPPCAAARTSGPRSPAITTASSPNRTSPRSPRPCATSSRALMTRDASFQTADRDSFEEMVKPGATAPDRAFDRGSSPRRTTTGIPATRPISTSTRRSIRRTR